MPELGTVHMYRSDLQRYETLLRYSLGALCSFRLYLQAAFESKGRKGASILSGQGAFRNLGVPWGLSLRSGPSLSRPSGVAQISLAASLRSR